MTTRWSVPPMWRGETVAILASGPSMSREVADSVRGQCRVIAVNNQGIDTEVDNQVVPALAPWADMLYAADDPWWRFHKSRALKFAGLKVTIREVLPYPEVLALRESELPIFDERLSHITTGKNSTYQAVHIAVHAGASRILLFGVDMRDVEGKKHWFGSHPPQLGQGMLYVEWLRAFDRLAVYLNRRGVEVFNCTPGSALKCFPFLSLNEALSVRTDSRAAVLSA